MKVLRIYDHLGELKKEFPVYVEGEDFKWQSSYPEPVWLGTITLEEAGTEPEKPSEGVSEGGVAEVVEPSEGYLDTKVRCSKCDWKGTNRECGFGHDDFYCPICLTQSLEVIKEEEVKDEPEKDNRTRSRVKRSTPSASPESTKRLHQDDFGRDTNQGD